MTTYARKVCIDPGHWGINESGVMDPGAVGARGTMEATVVMEVSFILREMLQALGYEVILTHEEPDPAVNNLTPRAEIANQWGADIFVGIHANSFSSPNPKGFEVWTTPGQNESDVLAEHLYQALGGTGYLGRPDQSDGDSDKEANFTVIRATWMPSALVELGFISNPDEELLLASPQGQTRYAQALADGIQSYFAGYPRFS